MTIQLTYVEVMALYEALKHIKDKTETERTLFQKFEYYYLTAETDYLPIKTPKAP